MIFSVAMGRVRVVEAMIVSLAVLFAGCSGTRTVYPERPRDGLRVATFNVHYVVDPVWAANSDRIEDIDELDQIVRWETRETSVIETVDRINADIVAFQEMETFAGGSFNRVNTQLRSVSDALPRYDVVATGDPAVYPTTQPILVRKGRFRPIEQGFFFFSSTPDQIYSDPWYGRYPSFATWVRIESIGSPKQTYLVVNVHIDRESYRNQLRSASLIVERVKELQTAKDMVIVLGDFNALTWVPVVTRVTKGVGAEAVGRNGATFHFNRGIHLFPAIDHILWNGGGHLRLDGTFVYRSRSGDVWPSDHYPVVADFTIHH